MNSPVQQELFAVIGSGNLFLLEEAIRGGADVNARAGDPNGDTPLIRAVAGGDVEMVRLLLGAGANPNAAGLLAGFTPVMISLEKPEILRELIAAGADVNLRTERMKGMKTVSGGTALHLAAAVTNIEATRILLEAGAEVEARDENGLAPLDLALKRGLPTETSVALLEAGAALTPERQRAMHSTAGEPESYLTGDSGISERAAEILRRSPRAVDFQNRKRPSLKYHLLISFLVLGAVYVLMTSDEIMGGMMTGLSLKNFLYIALIWFAGTAVNFFRTWNSLDPNCPNCSRNIQNCARNFCHDCGNQMHAGWCRRCQVPNLEKGLVPFLNPYAADDRRTIDYCPGCGVWLESGLYRRKWWQGGW